MTDTTLTPCDLSESLMHGAPDGAEKDTATKTIAEQFADAFPNATIERDKNGTLCITLNV